MLKRRSPISKEVGGGLATSVAASWPSVVWRPVWQMSWTGAASNHRRTSERHVARFADFGCRATVLGRLLLNREGFAGQQRLVNKEIAARQQHPIGRHQVAGGKPGDVARDQLVDWQAGFRTVAAHVRPQRYLLTQRVDGILSLARLSKVKQHREQHDASDDYEACDIARSG
jgi:hypothetical protein